MKFVLCEMVFIENTPSKRVGSINEGIQPESSLRKLDRELPDGD